MPAVGNVTVAVHALDEGAPLPPAPSQPFAQRNDVTEPGVMGGAENAVMIVSRSGVERWDRAGKGEVAMRIADRMAKDLA